MLIEEMVRIPSPSGNESELVDYLVAWASRNGFDAHEDDEGNFIARKGQGRRIMLVGHVDTVPGEIPVRIENGSLYGRGSVDAKGSLACFLEAARIVEDIDITVVGAVAEETDSRGARHLLNGPAPELIVIGEPSGWSSVTLGYKGYLSARLEFISEAGHGSRPGPNSTEKAISLYNSFMDHIARQNEGLSMFRTIDARVIRLATSDDPFEDRATLFMAIRLPPECDVEGLMTFLREASSECRTEFSEPVRAVETNRANELASVFTRAIRQCGGRPGFKLKSGTSDMNILQEFDVPIVAYGPGDSSLDHTPNEHLELEEFEKAVLVMKKVLSGFSN